MDVTQYLERCGVRRARFGGYEQEDVRKALQALCADYEQRLAHGEEELRTLRQENAALQSRCRTLTGQCQSLSAQNARLAGNTELHARRGDELGNRLASLQERNRSLNDQIARIKLQNGDLLRENSALQDQVQQAETALRLKGEDLDRQRDELNASRDRTLSEAQAEAERITGEARAQAEQTALAAKETAAAMEETARRQATAQARRLVEAAAAEANEIQNAHQLRLNDLTAQIQRMEQKRDSLAGYLARIGGELLETQTRVREAPAQSELPPPPLELRPVEVPPLELDFSDLSPAQPPEPAPRPDGELPTQVVSALPRPDAPEPDGTAPSPHQGFTLLHEELPLDGSGHRTGERPEVPGEIFSYPIRHEEAAPLPGDAPPAAAPRLPVLPVIPEEDEEDPMPDSAARVLDELNVLGGRPAVPPPPRDRRPRSGAERARRRRNAVRALKALRRIVD